ncbi:MAB_1171c family putative transporter [Streptomyces sp. NPDC088726]|uniref:MAB_1171c family putative transporter n=1 Tax=Streptomyces sp. NPDC088726 TaxID=3365874 RepID=UPI003828BDBE
MAGDATALSDSVQHVSIVCLWAAVVLRAPWALRRPDARGLWLAVATGAAATTLNSTAVLDFCRTTTGSPCGIGLVKNLIGVVSAIAVLHFVAATTSRQGLTVEWRLRAGLTLVTLVLVGLIAARDGAGTAATKDASLSVTVYGLTIIGIHLTANYYCFIVCWRYGKKAGPGLLGTGLRLFAVGTAMAEVYWLGRLVHLATPTETSSPYLSLFLGLHGLFRATALLMPAFATTRRVLADVVLVWRLWPLWHNLVAAVPNVALGKPRSRLLELLWPQMPLDVLVYRKVIETRDAILVLLHHVPVEVAASALLGVAPVHCEAGGEPDAEALAAAIRQARHAKLTGLSHTHSCAGMFGMDDAGPREEAAFLVEVAAAYRRDAGAQRAVSAEGPAGP